jgi:hypothetical protein
VVSEVKEEKSSFGNARVIESAPPRPARNSHSQTKRPQQQPQQTTERQQFERPRSQDSETK